MLSSRLSTGKSIISRAAPPADSPTVESMSAAASSTTSAHSSRWLGVLAVLFALLGWSSIPLFLKYFTHDIDPWTSNGWRYGSSALFWSPVLVYGLWKRMLRLPIWLAALGPSVVNCAAQVAFCKAHYDIDPGLLSFGLRSNIVFTVLGAAILFAPERVIMKTRCFVIGVLLVVLGTMGTIMLSPHGIPKGATLSGVLLAITAGAGFAGYALAVRYWMHGINPIHAFAIISFYTAIGMVVLMVLFGKDQGMVALDLIGQPISDTQHMLIPIDKFSMLMLSALIGVALGHVAYYYAIAKLGVAVSSGVIQLQPFFVSIASFWLFHEYLTVWQWISGSIAVLGATLILMVQHRKSHALVDSQHAVESLEYANLPPDQVAAMAASAEETHSDIQSNTIESD